MQFKKLYLSGFKTFADKTEIEIGEGLTAVVGPNGCGKSNIADALLWVMGEQNPRLLRGSESRDVIFNGTDRRKPLGLAEVRLTVDNADGSLPVDFAEVTVTRRIYRSGESAYLLNNAPCRLKDIVELFLDTGIGRGAYGFVSQSEIDAVLSARPEDRRELFEEAAGIKKYRVKKREAQRKLETAEGNLTRVRDILWELEQGREPLREQAEQAKRYLELTARLGQIEVDLLVAEIQKTDYELYAARQDREVEQLNLNDADGQLIGLDERTTRARESSATAEAALEAARRELQETISHHDRLENRLAIIRERGAASERSADSLDAEIAELAARITTLDRTVEDAKRALEKLTATEERRKVALEDAQAKQKLVDQEFQQASREASDSQGLLRRLADQRSQREVALASCQSRITETTRREERLAVDLQAAQTDRDHSLNSRTESEMAAGVARSEHAAQREARTMLEDSRRNIQAALIQAQTDLDVGRRQLADRGSRLYTLVEMQETGDGYYQGVRAVLQAVKANRLSGNYTPVVELLDVPEDLRVAIEVALGASAQDVVCDSESEARAAIELLKQDRSGRATFLALPMLRPGQGMSSRDAIGKGIIGIASDMVTCDAKYSPAVQLLLNRVLLADTIESAVAASRTLGGGWSRIVTREGELITPGGAMTGGSLGGRGAHLVGRKGEIDDLRKELPALETRVKDSSAAAERISAELQESDSKLSNSGREMEQSGARLAALERDLVAANNAFERTESRLRDLTAERDRVVAALTTLQSEENEWSAAVEAGKAEDLSADDAILAAQERAKRLEKDRETFRNATVKEQVEYSRLREQAESARRELRTSELSLAEAVRMVETRRTQRELAGSEFANSEQIAKSMEIEAAEAKRSREVKTELLAARQTERDSLRTALDALLEEERSATRIKSAAMQAIHEAELKIARFEVKLSQTGLRVMDEYGISTEEALARPEVVDLDKNIVQEIGRLRRESRAMGQVNTGAVEEFERLTERFEFLTEQKTDLETARENLLGTIAEIDESTRETFMDTFDAVSDKFSEIFQRLFGGGSTRLTLTRPDDLLETGIEIIAQPPGKKPQHLSLLSGGERALTAVAILFSFLAVRPSPFVLLDEVDAPLDGANVQRFVDLVKDFSKTTQFLVITHNPTTMEAAPSWYGITMKDAGVSSILSYRVPEQSLFSDPDEAMVLA